MRKFLLLIGFLVVCFYIQADVQFSFPEYPQGTTLASLLMDASAEKVTFLFVAPKTGNLSKITFLTGTVNTGDTVRVSFQDVSLTDGFPDGVVDQYRTVVIADSDDNTTKQTGIISSDGTDGGVKRAVTRGDLIACVIDYSSYVAGSINIRGASINSASTFQFLGSHYAALYTASWAKSASVAPNIAIEYDDGTYANTPGITPYSVMGSVTYSSTNVTQDEVALLFQVPVQTKVIGGWFFTDIDAATEAILYDSGGTALATVTLDPDVSVSDTELMVSVFFTSEITLNANSNYRWALKPTTATNNTIRYIDVPSAAAMDQLSGGQLMYWSARVDAGAWTPTTTRRPIGGMLVSSLPAAVASGGSGGFRVVQ